MIDANSPFLPPSISYFNLIPYPPSSSFYSIFPLHPILPPTRTAKHFTTPAVPSFVFQPPYPSLPSAFTLLPSSPLLTPRLLLNPSSLYLPLPLAFLPPLPPWRSSLFPQPVAVRARPHTAWRDEARAPRCHGCRRTGTQHQRSINDLLELQIITHPCIA